ncbi:MAG TPA: hypothetical protein VGI75_04565 [Pirellulales bacterium]|jgi:hypothetical protein
MNSRCRPAARRYATCCGAFACRNSSGDFDSDDLDFEDGDRFDPEPLDDNFDEFDDLDESDETDPPEELWDEGDWE